MEKKRTSSEKNLWHELIEEIHDRIHVFNEITYQGLDYYQKVAQKDEHKQIISQFNDHYTWLMSNFLESLGEPHDGTD